MNKMNIMKQTIYLVDSENVNDAWVQLLPKLERRDRIIVFHTKNSPHFTTESASQMADFQSRLTWEKCFTGTNGLDFQLVSRLGYLICKKPKATFVIVSNDTGFDAAIKYWVQEGKQVSRIRGASCKEEAPLTEVQEKIVLEDAPDKQQRKHKKRKKKKSGGGQNQNQNQPEDPDRGQPESRKDQKGQGGSHPEGRKDQKGQGGSQSENRKDQKGQGGSQSEGRKDQKGQGGSQPESRKDQAGPDRGQTEGRKDQKGQGGGRSENRKGQDDPEGHGRNQWESRKGQDDPEGHGRNQWESRKEQDDPEGHDRGQQGSRKGSDKKGQDSRDRQNQKKDIPVSSVLGICRSISMDRHEMIHEALVALLGAADGREVYYFLKDNQEFQSQLCKIYLPERTLRVDNYLKVVFGYHKEEVEDMNQIWGIVNKYTAHDRNGLFQALTETFGHKKGARYYGILKPHVRVLKKL